MITKTFKAIFTKSLKVFKPSEFKRMTSEYGFMSYSLLSEGTILIVEPDESTDIRDFIKMVAIIAADEITTVGLITEEIHYEPQF
jgi:hypothetical protein